MKEGTCVPGHLQSTAEVPLSKIQHLQMLKLRPAMSWWIVQRCTLSSPVWSGDMLQPTPVTLQGQFEGFTDVMPDYKACLCFTVWTCRQAEAAPHPPKSLFIEHLQLPACVCHSLTLHEPLKANTDIFRLKSLGITVSSISLCYTWICGHFL